MMRTGTIIAVIIAVIAALMTAGGAIVSAIAQGPGPGSEPNPWLNPADRSPTPGGVGNTGGARAWGAVGGGGMARGGGTANGSVRILNGADAEAMMAEMQRRMEAASANGGAMANGGGMVRGNGFARGMANGVAVDAGGDSLFGFRAANGAGKASVDRLRTPSGIDFPNGAADGDARDAPSPDGTDRGLTSAVAVSVDFSDRTRGEAGNAAPARRQEVFSQSMAASFSNVNGRRESEESLTATLDWLADDAPLLRETRTISATADTSGARPVTRLTWRAELSLPPGVERATLQRHELGISLPTPSGDGKFLRSAATGARRTTPRWVAYTTRIDGSPVTVAIIDGPQNPRPITAIAPTVKNADGPKDAGATYFGVVTDFGNEPLELTSSGTVALEYEIRLWDGTLQPRQIEAELRAVNPNAVR